MRLKYAAKVLSCYNMGNTLFTEYLRYIGGLSYDGKPKDTRTPQQNKYGVFIVATSTFLS